jgi:hypothetical protein
MKLVDAVDEVLKKEEEGKLRRASASSKADETRYEGEEKATRLYRELREGLKDKTREYRASWEKKLNLLGERLKKERAGELKRLKLEAVKKRLKAAQVAYHLLVEQP